MESASPIQPSPGPLTLETIAQSHLESYLPPRRIENELQPLHSTTMIYPHVTLTYAQSVDGQISLQPGAQTILSGPETKAMTHYLRSRHDGILVGIGTAKADNPGLNTRYSEDGKEIVGMERQPRPLILDPSGRWNIHDTPKLFALAEKREGKAPWWIVCSRGDVEMADKVEKTEGLWLDGGVYKGRDEGVDWDVILREIAKNGITSVMIEGGGSVIRDLLRKKNQKYVSSVIVTIAPTYLGAGGVDIAPIRSLKAQNEVNLSGVKWIPLGQDVVMAGILK